VRLLTTTPIVDVLIGVGLVIFLFLLLSATVSPETFNGFFK